MQSVERNRALARAKIQRGRRAWQIRCIQCRIRVRNAKDGLADKCEAARDRAATAAERRQRLLNASRARNRATQARTKQRAKRATARARARQAQIGS
jgi:hypothetical protein